MAVRRPRIDEEAVSRVVRFTSHLPNTESGWKGTKFQFVPWQLNDIVRPLFGTLGPDGYRQYHTCYVEIPKKNGKALALDTALPTPTGWTTMGEVGVGDSLFDERGQPCRVIAATEIMLDRPCYEVRFNDGANIVADAEHEWYTEAWRTGRPRGRRRSGSTADNLRTTAEIAATLTVDAEVAKAKTCWNHRVPVAKPLAMPHADLPIDPYVLGVWLGDGHSRAASLTVGRRDLALLEELRRIGLALGEVHSSGTGAVEVALGVRKGMGLCRRGHPKKSARTHCRVCGRIQTRRRRHGLPPLPYTNLSLQEQLRSLNLLNNKHVPTAYLRASQEQRVSLLQGLMDTDGYVSKVGQCEFTTTAPALRDGAIELIASLGMKPLLTTGRACVNGKDCGEKYRIQFWAFADTPIFRLARKRGRQKATPSKATRTNRRQIVAVRSVPSVPVRCIQVDSPSGLFLAGRSMIPTHNSGLLAALAPYLLFADGEPSAEIYGVASDKSQANIVFKATADMIEACPALKDRCKISRLTKTITVTSGQAKGNFYRVISADAPRQHGYKPHVVLFDELHTQPNRELYDTLTQGASDTRRQPILFLLTTAGWDRNSVCYEVHEYALKVKAGRHSDPSFLPVIYAAEPGDDWESEATWKKANPSLGHILPIERLREHYRRAKAIPGQQGGFKRLRLNIWTQQSTRWLGQDTWDANGGLVTEEALLGKTCYGGLDLSQVSDMTAWVMAFPDEEDPDLLRFLARFWVPEARLTDSANPYASDYQVWHRAGYLQTTPGDAVDYDYIEKQIVADADKFAIAELNIDNLFQGHQVAVRLAGEGLTVLQFRLSFTAMTAPMSEFERRLLVGKLNHGGNPILRFNADNANLIEKAGLKRLDKASSQGKIDGLVCMIMALERCMAHGAAQRKSVYATRGIQWL